MKMRYAGITLAGALLLMLGLCACESDNDKPPVNVAGDWSVTMNAVGQSSETFTLTLHQEGSSVASSGGEEIFMGSISGDTLTLHIEVSVPEDNATAKIALSGPVTETTMNLSGTMQMHFADGSKAEASVTLTGTRY